jgi:heat shock protein HtpX
VNLFEQQAANRRKSMWLVLLFVLFFAWLGFGGDFLAWEFTRYAPPGEYRHTFPWFGVLLSAVAYGLVAYIRRTGADKVLWSTGAWQLITADTPEQRQLQNVVEEMAIAAGLPPPTIYIVDDPDPNAFVTGTDQLKSHLVVTSGLLTMLDRDELQGVIAHEMGHVKNLDMQLMTMVAGLAGAIALIADGSLRVLRHGRLLGRGARGGGGKGGKNAGPLFAVLLVVWLVSWLLAPLVTRLLAMGISRKREYLADAMSAQFTRNPMALATALDKIEKAGAPTKAIKGGVAHLCIADPLGRNISSRPGLLGDLFATHPPMALRVARLRGMAFQAEKRGGDLPPE